LEDRLERDERHRCLRTRGRRRSSGGFLQYHANYPRCKRLVQHSLSPSFRSIGVGLLPFPRRCRGSQFLTAYVYIDGLCLAGCPCHYSMHIGYYCSSVAIQVGLSSQPATGNPAFSNKLRCDAFRFSFRSMPPFICGWPGKLTGVCLSTRHAG